MYSTADPAGTAARALELYFDGHQRDAMNVLASAYAPPPAMPKPRPVPPPPPPPRRPAPPLPALAVVPRPPRIRFETYCFLCGRGLGLHGVLVITDHPPDRQLSCRTCGGLMFVRDVSLGLTPLENPEHALHHETHARKVA